MLKIILTTILVLFPVAVFATDLESAPIIKKPTIRSEILRGKDSAMRCVTSSWGNNVYVCMFDALRKEKNNNNENDAFTIGVKIVGWWYADTTANMELSKSFYKEVAQLQSNLSIDDETIISLSGTKPEETLHKFKQYK